MKKNFTIIAATDLNGGIGLNGKLPWNNKTDMKYFKNITCQCMDETKKNAIIMGRKTFESIDCKPLPNRLNVCITSISPFSAMTSSGDFTELRSVSSHEDLGFATPLCGPAKPPVYSVENNKNILFFHSLDTALKQLYKMTNIENIFVIGGATLYKEAINHQECDELLINCIECSVDCDTFFPEIDSNRYLLANSNHLDDTVLNQRYIHRCNRYNSL